MSIDITARITLDNEDFSDPIDWDAIPRVNMANGNACTLLRNLGFSGEWIQDMAQYGAHVTPLDMRARCELLLALPAYAESTDTVKVGNHTVFGTDIDYMIDRVRQILEIVEWCDSKGLDVAIN